MNGAPEDVPAELRRLALRLQGLAQAAQQALNAGEIMKLEPLTDERAPLMARLRTLAARAPEAVRACAELAEAGRLEEKLVILLRRRQARLHRQLLELSVKREYLSDDAARMNYRF